MHSDGVGEMLYYFPPKPTLGSILRSKMHRTQHKSRDLATWGSAKALQVARNTQMIRQGFTQPPCVSWQGSVSISAHPS